MRRWNYILAMAVVLTLGGIAAACPNCKDTIAATDTAGTPGVAGAFNSSVFLMLGGLFATLGIVGRVMYKAIRGS